MAKRWASKYTDDLAKEDFRVFNSTGINGILIKQGIVHHTTSFKVNNDTKEFVFHPRVGVSKSSDFTYFAEIGDSIIKPPFSNTLVLIKEHKSYTYTFE